MNDNETILETKNWVIVKAVLRFFFQMRQHILVAINLISVFPFLTPSCWYNLATCCGFAMDHAVVLPWLQISSTNHRQWDANPQKHISFFWVLCTCALCKEFTLSSITFIPHAETLCPKLSTLSIQKVHFKGFNFRPTDNNRWHTFSSLAMCSSKLFVWKQKNIIQLH